MFLRMNILFLSIQSFITLSSATCNYISFGSYGIPASPSLICTRESNGITASLARYPSFQYICNASYNIITKKEYFCFISLSPSIDTCGSGHSGTRYYCGYMESDNTLSDVINYQNGDTDDDGNLANVHCSTGNNNCDYVVYEYYVQPAENGNAWYSIYQAIVVNECINKQIYGCNNTNIWIINYIDNDCTHIDSINFYSMSSQSGVYPRSQVELCTQISFPPSITTTMTSDADSNESPSTSLDEYLMINGNLALTIGVAVCVLIIFIVICVVCIKIMQRRNKKMNDKDNQVLLEKHSSMAKVYDSTQN